MTDKITKEQAEKSARRRAFINMHLNGPEILENALINAEISYQEEFAELAPRIIPESPWRPIEECPKEKYKSYIICVGNNIDTKPHVCIARFISARILGEKIFGFRGEDRTFWVDTDIQYYMEIPALPDEVA